METMYFIFGVLSVIVLTAIGAIIYSIVEISRIEKQIKDIRKDIHQRIDKLEAGKQLIKG